MKNFKTRFLIGGMVLTVTFIPVPLQANEVLEGSQAKVVVKTHPKTGKPYVALLGPGASVSPNAEVAPVPAGERPDYRMLDPKVRSGEIPYHGPSSDRKKVYLFAAGLATLGVVSATAAAAAIPAAAATSGSAGGAGAYAAAGVATGAGTVSTAWLKTRPDPEHDDFKRESESKLIHETNPD